MIQTLIPAVVPPKIVILEGVDRSGKGSLQLAINKLTKYKHIVVDRGPVGFKAYCHIFKKDPELCDKYELMEQQLLQMPNVVMIYLTATDEELQRRCDETNHEDINYSLHKFMYEYEYKSSKLEKYSFDTTHHSAEEIVQRLIEREVL